MKIKIKKMLKHTTIGLWLYNAYLKPVLWWKSVCMRLFGVRVLALVNEALEESNSACCLWAGSLIGLVRDGGFLPWDNDIDYVCLPDQVAPYKLLCSLKARGFKFRACRGYEKQIDFMNFICHNISVDFYFMSKDAGCMMNNEFYTCDPLRNGHGPDCYIHRVANVTRIVDFNFKGVKVPIPENYDEILTEEYGQWRHPDPTFKYNEVHNRGRLNDREHCGTYFGENEIKAYRTTNHL